MEEEIFKPGEDVVCIDNELFGWVLKELTKDKVYNVITTMYTMDNSVEIRIVDDLNNISFFHSNRFISLHLYRSKILESILE